LVSGHPNAAFWDWARGAESGKDLARHYINRLLATNQTRLSRRKQGSESPRERQHFQVLSRFFQIPERRLPIFCLLLCRTALRSRIGIALYSATAQFRISFTRESRRFNPFCASQSNYLIV